MNSVVLTKPGGLQGVLGTDRRAAGEPLAREKAGERRWRKEGAENGENAGGRNGKTPQHTFCIWWFSDSSVPTPPPRGHLEREEVAKGTQVLCERAYRDVRSECRQAGSCPGSRETVTAGDGIFRCPHATFHPQTERLQLRGR